MRLVLFFSHNVSLASWETAGILGREVRLYRRLAEKGNEVIFVTYGDETDYQWQNKWPGISIVPLFAYRRKPRSRILLWLLTLLLPYRIRIDVPIPDLIKTNQVIGGMLAVKMKKIWNRPLIARSGYDPYMFALNNDYSSVKLLIIRLYVSRVYKSADLIHVATKRDAKFVRDKYFGKVRCDIEIRPNWVDTLFFCGVTREEGYTNNNRVLAIGRPVDQKNFELMIQAISLGPYGLDIITSKEGKTFLKEYAEEIGADVRIFPQIPHSQLPEIYRRYPIYLITSKYEGHPKTLLEAMACGRGVVGTRVPGIVDVIGDGCTGILVEETPVAIQTAINRLMSDHDVCWQLGNAASKFIRQYHSLDNAVIQEIQSYRNLLSKHES